MGFQISGFQISIGAPSTDPKCIGPCKCELGDTYAAFHALLEEIGVVDWPFQFRDSEINYRINKKLERLNKVRPNVYVVPDSSASLSCTKRMRAENAVCSNLAIQISTPDPHDIQCKDSATSTNLHLSGVSAYELVVTAKTENTRI
jgi:hypothetical protein